ncbi:MAG: hypothetical protein AAGD43_31950, partial [Pseudomonadota bacterium]
RFCTDPVVKCYVVTLRKTAVVDRKVSITRRQGVYTVDNRANSITDAERVFSYINKCGQPVSAYDMLDGLRDDAIEASITNYRALQKLIDAGGMHRIEALNVFVVYCVGHDGKTPVFAICDDFGSVTEHIDTGVSQSISGLSKCTAFAPNHFALEIHGRCSDCDTGVPDH